MAKMEKLIELVRKYPILYDLSHEDYKNIRKKDKIWTEIGKELGENGDEIKKKWKNLRDTYAKQIRITKTKTGQAVTNTKKWIWADHMESFRPFLKFANTSSNVRDIGSTNSKSQESTTETNIPSVENVDFDESAPEQYRFPPDLQDTPSENSHEPSIESITSSAFTSPSNNTVIPHVTPIKPKVNRKRKAETSSSVSEMIKYFQSKKRIDYDATDQLFLAHARTVKSFSARRQIETKMKIAQLIMEQELLDLEETSSNHQQPRYGSSARSYPSISSVEHSVSSVGSPNDYAASSPQTETSQYYETNSGNTYATLSNETFDGGSEAVPHLSLSNFVTTFNPFNK